MPRILLDEGVPRPVLRVFGTGEAVTVLQIGWRSIRNGSLIREEEAHGLEVLVTTDKSMRH